MKIEFKIKSWRDCPIDTYYDICDIFDNTELSEVEKEISVLSILTEIDEETIYDLPIAQVRELLNKINWIGEFNINENVNFKKINICGEKYIVDADLTHFTTAQYIDFQTLWGKKDLRKYYGNILACFIIPKGKKYGEDYDINELAQKLRSEVDILTANEILFFYLTKLKNLMLGILIYSAIQIVKNKKKMTQENYLKVQTQWRQTLKDTLAGLSALTL